MLFYKMSVNIYMFHGGTIFEFLNGANSQGTDYQPSLTSYDYSAPLDEAGNPTPIYYAFQKIIMEHFGKFNAIQIDKNEIVTYGKVTF